MRSESQTKIEEKVNQYRDEVMTHLKYIKEMVNSNNKHLKELNGRVRNNEIAISWIKGIGLTVSFVLGSIIAWFKVGE